MIEIKNIYGDVIYVAPNAETVKSAVEDAVKHRARLDRASLVGASLDGASLDSANLVGASLVCKLISALRVFGGLYDYQVWAVLFQDGTRQVRMGCLFYGLEKWVAMGIRKSNLSEFPDDGSERSENRVAAFEFAKAVALRMAVKP